MKIAIFHNSMDNIGGAEIVDLILARELKADIYTTNIDEQKIIKMGFNTDNIFSIGKIPLNAPFRQDLAYWKFRKLNLGKKYDFYIIAGDWAMAGAINNQPNFWYVYSPMREIFDLYEYTRKNIVSLWQKPFFVLWVLYKRYAIKRNVRKIDNIKCISNNVQQRINKYFNQDSTVIYPPVETEKFHYQKNGDFWLSVNRLTTHKRVDMQLEAFTKMPDEKLVVIGSFERAKHFKKYADYIKMIKPKNVEIKSWVSQNELIDLYANCKGFITTSKDEDFGLGAVEAMASGKPVIAPNEGGYRETVIDGLTGKLIHDINSDKLIKAIKEIGPKAEKYKGASLAQAQKFDLKIFMKKIESNL